MGCSPPPVWRIVATAHWWSSASTRSVVVRRPTTSTASRSTTGRSSSRSAASPSRPAKRSERRSTFGSPARRFCTGSAARTSTSPAAGGGFLLGKLTRQGAKLVKGIGAARSDSGLPEDELTTAEWVSKYTKNEGVHGIFRNMCASVFAVGSEDLPARVFLTYFTRKSAFKRFGFHPQGTIGLWKGLADVVTSHGGEVWLSTEVAKIVVDGGKVTGVQIERDGATIEIASSIVVSDVGPAATVGLIGEDDVPEEYRDLVRKGDRPTAMISVNFASQERLVEVPGMLSFAKSRSARPTSRNFTDVCPEMAPEGWHLYVGTSVPKPSVGEFDEAAETELLLEDLRDTIDGFDERARILNVAVTRDGWPPQRAVAGFDLPRDTPFEGLWNVGDAVKEYANGGTTACAETAQLVVEEIAAAFSLTNSS